MASGTATGLIDTHMHILDRARFRYRWLPVHQWIMILT